jgi:glutamine amidotransferase
MPLEIEVLDLGINNLASLRRGLEDAGAHTHRVIASSNESRGADLMVLPGVGAFGAAIAELESRGLDEAVKRHVASGGYLFGVCLGMQLLTTGSEESPDAPGLDLIPGRAVRLTPNTDARVPNMGWTEAVAADDPDEEFTVFERALDFYFVHSYAVVPDDEADALAHSQFGDQRFVSAIRHDKILGVQFHPEKSSRPGHQLLSEVLEWANG